MTKRPREMGNLEKKNVKWKENECKELERAARVREWERESERACAGEKMLFLEHKSEKKRKKEWRAENKGKRHGKQPGKSEREILEMEKVVIEAKLYQKQLK